MTWLVGVLIPTAPCPWPQGLISSEVSLFHLTKTFGPRLVTDLHTILEKLSCIGDAWNNLLCYLMGELSTKWQMGIFISHIFVHHVTQNLFAQNSFWPFDIKCNRVALFWTSCFAPRNYTDLTEKEAKNAAATNWKILFQGGNWDESKNMWAHHVICSRTGFLSCKSSWQRLSCKAAQQISFCDNRLHPFWVACLLKWPFCETTSASTHSSSIEDERPQFLVFYSQCLKPEVCAKIVLFLLGIFVMPGKNCEQGAKTHPQPKNWASSS